MSDYRKDFDKIHNSLDKMDEKLDNHLERISKSETDITWIRGHINIVTALAVTLLSGLAVAYFQMKG
jgi:hypothetical protein